MTLPRDILELLDTDEPFAAEWVPTDAAEECRLLDCDELARILGELDAGCEVVFRVWRSSAEGATSVLVVVTVVGQ